MSYKDIEKICRDMPTELIKIYPDFDPEKLVRLSIVSNPYVHYACYQQHPHVVIVMFKCGASVSRKNVHGNTPLNIIACGYLIQYDLFIKWLFTKSDVILSINEPNNQGNTPLHTAVFWNNIKFIHILLEHGADPTITTPGGCRPSAIALRYNKIGMTRLLLNFERIFVIKGEWRPWNHHRFPGSYKDVMYTLLMLAKLKK